MESIKLNLGGGISNIDGFINVDKNVGKEVYPLEYADNSVDEMRASHILEHFGWNKILDVLTHWITKLKPGGIIKISVPNFSTIVDMYKTKSDARLGFYLFGGQINDNDYHKSAFDKSSLTELMSKAGLVDIEEWKDDIQDCSALPVSLNLKGRKPSIQTKIELPKNSVAAVMSMPRLVFSDTMTCLMRALISKGINLTRESGVFWGQSLTRLIEKQSEIECLKYIITIDYDSWFTYEDVTALLTLMETHPEYDAIVPLEVKREAEHILVGIKPLPGDKHYEVPKQEIIDNDILPVDTGHFGLTIFRKSCFPKVKKPWFIPRPDSEGAWGDGRIDEDVAFWHNFKESGCKLGLATKVKIGHLQLVVTYPGKIEDNWKPIHISLKDVDNKEKRERMI